MRRSTLVAAVLVSLGVARAQQADAPSPAASPPPKAPPSFAPFDLGEAKKLKVLYAGVLGSERAQAYLGFLRANFDEVGTLEVSTLSMKSAAPFDVVITDGKRLYPMDPKKPAIDQANVSLDASFTKPIVMIASMGPGVQRHTKIDWL